MTDRDWLKVVYRPDLEMEPGGSDGGTDGGTDGGADGGAGGEAVVVHLTPPAIELERAPALEQRHRVTVVPSERGRSWKLYLLASGHGSGKKARGRGVWWRAEPGSWQPLTGSRALVAEGRGRTRLDVWLRLDAGGGAEDGTEGGERPRLRFVGEAGG